MTRPTRRDFLTQSLTAGVALGAVASAPAVRAAPSPGPRSGEPAPKRLGILILGGTSFVGPHIVEYATIRGHTVTLFNRGKTNADLFPDLEKLHGNRDPGKDEGLKALEGTRRWDAVVDTSGYYPRLVRASAELLAERSGQYVFISSISVYADASRPGIDETSPVGTIPDETVETMGEGYANYGPLKALCEQAAERAYPGRATNIRPGLIVGPRDNGPRFTYWPVRVRRGGEVLSPGSPDDPVQYIDGRDLAEFVVTSIENRTTGVFNAAGPNWPTTIGEMLYGCKAVTGGSARFTWVNADFLAEQNVAPWMDMPVWVPPKSDSGGMGAVSIDKAVAAGLRSRPLAQTVADTLTWYDQTIAKNPAFKTAGIAADRESAVLAAWHASSHAPAAG